jgi:monofunctional biosynthetic peptidoglycan transglycosylase
VAGRAAASRSAWWLHYLTLPDAAAGHQQSEDDGLRSCASEADRAGKPFQFDQRWVPYSRISPNLRRAVLAAEDSAFWQHEGIDVEQIRLAVNQALERGDVPRGASTLTQQLAKNLYLSPSRNPLRKLRELVITRRLEAELSKHASRDLSQRGRVGRGVWGAEAARAAISVPASIRRGSRRRCWPAR